MTCIPHGTDKVSGNWVYSSGAAEKDENWLLIERYIQEESELIGRGTHGYPVAELNAARGWKLTYTDNNDLKLGPPTLELFHDLETYLDAQSKQYTDSISTWQRRYLAHIADSAEDVKWPGAESNLFKTVVSSDDFRRHWRSICGRCDQRFRWFIESELKKAEEEGGYDA